MSYIMGPAMVPRCGGTGPFSEPLSCPQFRHKSDNQVNNRQSQVLINGT